MEEETGLCEYIDLTGDKVVAAVTAKASDTPGTAATTKLILAGGTGKYTGIVGEWEGTRRSIRFPVEGQGLVATTYKGSYKLP